MTYLYGNNGLYLSLKEKLVFKVSNSIDCYNNLSWIK